MRTFKTKLFNKWAKKAGLSDSNLKDAVDEIERGLVDANLGGNLYKKRVATSTGGKSGGYRTLLAYKKHEKIFFVFGFEKNQRANINQRAEKALKAAAEVYLSLTDSGIKKALTKGELIEVKR